MDGVAYTGRTVLQLSIQEVRIHPCLLRESHDDLPVIIPITEFVCQALSQFTSAAAKFTAHGDDVSHVVSSVDSV